MCAKYIKQTIISSSNALKSGTVCNTTIAVFHYIKQTDVFFGQSLIIFLSRFNIVLESFVGSGDDE